MPIPRRTSTSRRTAAVGALVVMVLVAPACAKDDASSSPSTDTTASSVAAGRTTSSSAPSSTSTPSATGCTTGSPAVPDGAAHRETIDVDGDGRPDTSWITTVDGSTTVGISTAAGGGSEIAYDSASPIARSVFVTNADESGPGELIVSDGRGASLYAFVDCGIEPVLNAQGHQYEFDLQNLRGHGTGIGCIGTDAGRRLVGLQVTDRSDTEVSWTSTVIELDRLSATNGAERSGTYSLPADADKVALLDQITCGDRTMETDGLSERG